MSTQTTKSDALTDSTLSPFASPTASSFQDQGLTPRPPSLPYGANQYPPELLENRRRRKSRNQEQENEYAAVAGPPPPAAPEAPRAPPSSYKYPPASGGQPHPYPGPPPGIGRPSRQMAAEEYYKAPAPAPASLDRTRNMLDDPAMPRPQRTNTDPTLGRNSPVPNGHQRRASAAEQSLQRSARRSSAQHSAGGRPKVFAVDRSPLQRLELTLDSISKEDKRARAEAAEKAAREKAAAANGTVQQGEKSPQQVRFRERRPSVAAGDAPTIPITPTRPSHGSAGQNGPLSQHPPEEGRRYGTSGGPSPRAAAPESRIPVPVGQSPGIPQRNLSFRERAARNEVNLPNGLNGVAAKDVSPMTAPRNGSNKLKKPPPNNPWPNRVSETDEIYHSGEDAARTPRVVAGGPVMPITPRAGNPLDRPDHPPQYDPTPLGPEDVDDDKFGDEFLRYPSVAKLTKTPSQRKADQILGRAPTHTAATNGARQGAGILRNPNSPAATATPGAVSYAADTATPAPHYGAHQYDRGNMDPNEERRRVSDFIYHARDQLEPGQGTFKPTPYLDEWKKATVGALSGALLDLDDVPPAVEKGQNAAWWEGSPQSRRRSNSLSSRPKKAEAFEGEYDETNGTRTPNQQTLYPSIWEVQSGDLHQLSGSDVDGGLSYEPQHLAPPSRRAKARAKRWDGLRPFSPSPSAASDSQDSLGCFSLCSNDASFSRQALSYSCTTTPVSFLCFSLLLLARM